MQRQKQKYCTFHVLVSCGSRLETLLWDRLGSVGILGNVAAVESSENKEQMWNKSHVFSSAILD